MQIRERVFAVAADVFNEPLAVLSERSKPEHVSHWDSIGHMALVAALEREFGVTFDLDETMELFSLGDAIEVLQHKEVICV